MALSEYDQQHAASDSGAGMPERELCLYCAEPIDHAHPEDIIRAHVPGEWNEQAFCDQECYGECLDAIRAQDAHREHYG